jgi:hypothetical protein
MPPRAAISRHCRAIFHAAAAAAIFAAAEPLPPPPLRFSAFAIFSRRHCATSFHYVFDVFTGSIFRHAIHRRCPALSYASYITPFHAAFAAAISTPPPFAALPRHSFSFHFASAAIERHRRQRADAAPAALPPLRTFQRFISPFDRRRQTRRRHIRQLMLPPLRLCRCFASAFG